MWFGLWSRAVSLLVVQAAVGVLDDQVVNGKAERYAGGGGLADGSTFGGLPSSRVDVTDLRKRFPGYFRTSEEQSLIENSMKIVKGQPTGMTSQRYETCYSMTKCHGDNGNRQPGPPGNSGDYPFQPGDTIPTRTPSSCPLDSLGSGTVTRHACCVSRTSLVQPEFLTSATDSNVRYQIAQFPKLNLIQLFQHETCCQVAGCSICQCTQTFVLAMAVVVESSAAGLVNFNLKPVQVPGCCRCLNVN